MLSSISQTRDDDVPRKEYIVGVNTWVPLTQGEDWKRQPLVHTKGIEQTKRRGNQCYRCDFSLSAAEATGVKALHFVTT